MRKLGEASGQKSLDIFWGGIAIIAHGRDRETNIFTPIGRISILEGFWGTIHLWGGGLRSSHVCRFRRFSFSRSEWGCLKKRTKSVNVSEANWTRAVASLAWFVFLLGDDKTWQRRQKVAKCWEHCKFVKKVTGSSLQTRVISVNS